MRRSTYGFCHGERGAVTTSFRPMTRTRSRKAGPYDASSVRWLCRKLRQVGEGTLGRHGHVILRAIAFIARDAAPRRLNSRDPHSTDTISSLKPRRTLFRLRALLDMESPDPGGQGGKDGAHFEPRQVQADAHMRPRAKRQLVCRATHDIERVRIYELAFVSTLHHRI
jgi:hypothetical protein